MRIVCIIRELGNVVAVVFLCAIGLSLSAKLNCRPERQFKHGQCHIIRLNKKLHDLRLKSEQYVYYIRACS